MNDTQKKTDRTLRNRARLRRMLARGAAGLSLIEIMVVVIIIGLVSSAVGFGVFNQLKKAKVKTAEQAVNTLRSAVRMYENDHPGQCPTVEQMQADGTLDRNASTNDPWGKPFTIQCDNDEVNVSSNGPNGRQGDEDDIPNPSSRRN